MTDLSIPRGVVSADVEEAVYLGVALAAEQSDRAQPQAASAALPDRETVLVLDFGSQYTRLITRRIRECHVYCELLPPTTPWSEIAARRPRGIVLSGGPASVYDEGAPQAPPELWRSGVPILGICYGMGLMAQAFGGEMARVGRREYGPATVQHEPSPETSAAALFTGLPRSFPAWMSHADALTQLPPTFTQLATSDNAVAAIGDASGHLGVQFHPEVVHTPQGTAIIDNFLKRVCGCSGSWTPHNVVEESIVRIREQVGDGRVICALSGGVDSAVAATLIARAIGPQLICVFVDNGLLRQGEAQQLMEVFGQHLQIPVVQVDAVARFLGRLQGVSDPEEKRKIVGDEFIRVFAEQAHLLRESGGPIEFLAQGTLYPDVIESTSHDTVNAARIKTHHNVGGLPDDLPFRLVEPLRYLFKDEVREVGLELGLPERMVYRQPFPGPGLAIRIIGAVTPQRLETLRAADAIVVDEIRKAGLYRQLWQSFAILTPLKSVGVMGDGRTYADVVAVRAVTSDDAMTADWARLPYEVLATISNRIVNEVEGVNRVVYDVSSKPPATIEWE